MRYQEWKYDSIENLTSKTILSIHNCYCSINRKCSTNTNLIHFDNANQMKIVYLNKMFDSSFSIWYVTSWRMHILKNRITIDGVFSRDRSNKHKTYPIYIMNSLKSFFFFTFCVHNIVFLINPKMLCSNVGLKNVLTFIWR